MSENLDLPRGASLMRVKDGRVTQLTIYFNREGALTDLGLGE
jgi:hypothetical protein